MSEYPVDLRDGAAIGAATLLARAAAADAGAHLALFASIQDFALPEAGRLDERMRVALGTLVRAVVDAAEQEVGADAAGLLRERGASDEAAALAGGDPLYPRLAAAGLLRDRLLMGELVQRVRHDLIAAALPATLAPEADRASMMSRYLQHADRMVATSAMAVMIAESRRRGGETRRLRTELSLDLHARLVWLVAAALRGRAEQASLLIDQALVQAAVASLARHDESDRLESAAMRFAVALDAEVEELPRLLLDALADRRLALFIALLAHGCAIDFDTARTIVLEPAGDRLWLALRALDMPREGLAQIGYALSEADPRRDLEAFADMIDAIAAIPPDQASAALDTLRLHPDYRAAVQRLGRKAA